MNNKKLNDNLPFAALTLGEAKQVIAQLLSDQLSKINPKETEEKIFDMVNIKDATEHLNSLGYPIKQGSLYNLTASKLIPFRKIGRRVVFSRNELTNWVKEKMDYENVIR